MKIRLFRILLCAFVLFCFVSSCKDDKQPEDPVDKIITTNVSVPSPVEIEEGQSIFISLKGKTNIKDSDFVVLRSAANKDYRCPIINLTDSFQLEFKPVEGVTNGNYKVYICRNDVNYYIGTMQLTLLKSLTIEPEEGTNVYGIVQCNGKGVPDVLLSDGEVFVKTNQDGIYQMKSSKKWQYVFIILPSGYEVPSQGILPQIHATLTSDISKAERKDFELIESDNYRFTLFVCGDMHLANRTDDIKQFNELARTLNADISAAPGKRYLLTLGDMTWDLYWYSKAYEFPQYLSTMNSCFKDILFFHTMGNHDNDMNSVGDFNKAFHYTRDVAPTFYSYNLGKIHFVVLDDIDYNNVGANNDGTGKDYRSQYVRNLTAEQMDWLKKDLSYVSKSTPVFISSHAPVFMPKTATTWRTNLTGSNSAGEGDTEQLLDLVKDYNVHFLSGHTHNIFNYKHSSAFEDHNVGAVCASWWWSGYLTPGIHLSQDGAPGGYGVWEFDGTNFKHIYHAAGHDDSYQFRAYDMNSVKSVITPGLGNNHKDFMPLYNEIQGYKANSILVNVWDFGPDWKISIKENGHELNVSQIMAYDPLHIVALSAPRCKSASASSTPSFLTTSWNHFFLATASSANSTVIVTVTDENGRSYSETMVRPKAFKTTDYTNK
ncbi:MAG: calcineurin-like phosphoesterase C-terminal domain-containing protein [Bacteroidales bacterium]|nr:calcineurin-like phosphoesterase C-terminal domain-containing protein [Bacteroidales bacterium]